MVPEAPKSERRRVESEVPEVEKPPEPFTVKLKGLVNTPRPKMARAESESEPEMRPKSLKSGPEPGTPSVAPFALATAGAGIIARAGVGRIAAANQGLIDRIVAALPAAAFASHVAKGERGCSFIVRPRDADKAAAALAEEKIVFDRRQGGLRFSIHLYNDEADAARLIAALTPFV